MARADKAERQIIAFLVSLTGAQLDRLEKVQLPVVRKVVAAFEDRATSVGLDDLRDDDDALREDLIACELEMLDDSWARFRRDQGPHRDDTSEATA